MQTRTMRVMAGALGLALACALITPTQASARGRGWHWALPLGVAAVTIAGLTYYTLNGVYYRADGGGYMEVPPPAEAMALPAAPPEMVIPPPLSTYSEPGPVVGMVVVSAASLNVRSGPGYNYSVITVVGQGTVLEVMNYSGGWVSVRTPTGDMGWVLQQFTRPSDGIPSNG